MKLLSCCLALFIANTAFADQPLTINGQALNPACLAKFSPTLVNQSDITALNINVCQKQASLPQGITFKYNLIGRTLNGVYVVDTYTNTGGSGVFQNVMLVRPATKTLYSNDSNGVITSQYTALVYLGSLGGGDRFTGSYHDLQVAANTLTGLQYSDKNPAGIKQYPDSKVSIDLSQVK